MIKQTIQTSNFVKKTYAKPKLMAYQVDSANIICESPNSTAKTEEYEEVPTVNLSWF